MTTSFYLLSPEKLEILVRFLRNMMISFLDQTTIINVAVYITMWLVFHFIFMRVISNANMNKYQKTMQEFHFYWYIIQVLSGRPWIEMKNLVNGKKASAWGMKKMVKCSLSLDIVTESEAIVVANMLFQKVAKPGSKFIELEDLARFLPKEDAMAILRFVDTPEGEPTQISCSFLQLWIVYAFRLERSLVLSMKDTDSIITSMSRIACLVFGIVLAIGWIPVVLGEYIDFLFWQCLAIFIGRQSTLVRDSIIFLFFFNPLEVGEICRINGDELVVKKINFFSTTFVRLNREECRMGNGSLLRKSIEHFDNSSRLEKIQLIQR